MTGETGAQPLTGRRAGDLGVCRAPAPSVSTTHVSTTHVSTTHVSTTHVSTAAGGPLADDARRRASRSA
ncbi:MAG: hypothetical protein ACOYBU_14655, partial [Dermatophilaceae bacterium]